MKNTLISIKNLVLIFILAISANLNLQAQTSQGTEFWLAFPANYDATGVRQLYITAENNSVVNINITDPAFSTTVNITAGTLETITLPMAVEVTGNGSIHNKGIHVTSDNPVTVYVMSQRDFSTDAYLGLPVDALGNDYYVMAYENNNLGIQLTVVATEDNTNVSITPTASSPGWSAGVTGNVVLNTGQVFQLRTTASGSDYTGSRVVSDKPVGVFGSNNCANIPVGVTACDYIVQQLTPVNTWGQSFVTVPLAERTAGDVFRIMAQQSNTEVSINGSVVATLNAGQFYQTDLSSTSYNKITANKPILVGQFCKGVSADNTTGDPCFSLIPPDEQVLNNYVISAGTSNIAINYLNITSPTSNTGNVKVDGASVAPSSWTAIPGTTYSGAQVSVPNGIHTVTSNLPIGLLVYGYTEADSYAYIGGQAFGEVATVVSLTISPKTGSSPINTTRCWQATLLNNFGEPVTGVRVDFNITGPNSASTGFAFTNESGIATFCYDGPNPGTDNIMAVVGALNDTASFTWSESIQPIPLSNWAVYVGIAFMLSFVVIRFRRIF
ncbi:MAG: hypothetical protein GX128_10305 [Bacteroidales bacterium]|jgi:hypothetical protein|nr:hypothetical protein [Bacteroidales bacterium]